MFKKLSFFLLGLLFFSCSETAEQPSDPSGKPRVNIVCTTGMIGDAVKNLMGEHAQVKVLMGPGVDPHLYKATQGDIAALTKAQIIVYNGLHLEGKMTDIFEKLQRNKTTIAMGKLVPEERLINTTEYAGANDPHIWFDVELWATAVEKLSELLAEAAPGHAEEITANTEVYLRELKELDAFVESRISEIPGDQRIMITAHDAFKYFGKAYGIEVRGLQGISTASEYGIRDISNLVNFIVEKKIPAIFVESSVSRRSVEAVIEGAHNRGHDLELGGELFSDAMGAEGTEEGTYLGMVRHNVEVIVEALK